MVQGQIRADPTEPGFERRLPFLLSCSMPQSEEHLLRQIVRRRGATDDPDHMSVDRGSISLEQEGETILFCVIAPVYEFLVSLLQAALHLPRL